MDRRRPLLWWIDKTSKPNTCLLREGTGFIGRLNREDAERYDIGPSLCPAGVYIFGLGEPVYTGIDDVTVSRRHAKIVVEGNKVSVADHGPTGRGSKNGTFVNGVKISTQPYRLSVGDVIRIGASTSVNANPTEFVVGEADSSTGRPVVELPTMKPIQFFSNTLESAVERMRDTDRVVLRPGERIDFTDEYGIRYVTADRPLFGLLITLQETVMDILSGINEKQWLPIENAVRRIDGYFGLKAYQSLLSQIEEPSILKLSEDCKRLTERILRGYGSTDDAMALCKCLREFTDKLGNIMRFRGG